MFGRRALKSSVEGLACKYGRFHANKAARVDGTFMSLFGWHRQYFHVATCRPAINWRGRTFVSSHALASASSVETAKSPTRSTSAEPPAEPCTRRSTSRSKDPQKQSVSRAMHQPRTPLMNSPMSAGVRAESAKSATLFVMDRSLRSACWLNARSAPARYSKG